MINKINEKVGLFDSEEELMAKLTNKELSLIKLVKAEEFLEDLYHAVLNPETNPFPPQDSYNKIKTLLSELRTLQK